MARTFRKLAGAVPRPTLGSAPNAPSALGWREFLNQKVSDPQVRQARITKVEAWQTMHPKPEWTPTPEVKAIEAELREMTVAFGIKCAELRKAVADAKAPG